jgi:hypothetical protein
MGQAVSCYNSRLIYQTGPIYPANSITKFEDTLFRGDGFDPDG